MVRVILLLLASYTLSGQSLGLAVGGHNYNTINQKDGVNVGVYYENPIHILFQEQVAPIIVGGQVSLTNNTPMYQVWARTDSKYYGGGALVWYYDLDFFLIAGISPAKFRVEPRLEFMVSLSGNIITKISINYEFTPSPARGTTPSIGW